MDTNQQSVSGVSGASRSSDFQPPTQNPQSNVNSNLQTTGTGVQTTTNDILNGQRTILVPTQNGNVPIAPTTTGILGAQTTAPAKHPPVVAWVGAGIVVLLLAVMAVGIVRPRKY